jgi:hypothetical protein
MNHQMEVTTQFKEFSLLYQPRVKVSVCGSDQFSGNNEVYEESCTFYVTHRCRRHPSSMYHVWLPNALCNREGSVNALRDGALLIFVTSRSSWLHDEVEEDGEITMICVTNCKMPLGISVSECLPGPSSLTWSSCREGRSSRHRNLERINPTSFSFCRDGSSATEFSSSRLLFQMEALYEGFSPASDKSWRTRVWMVRNREMQGIS